MGEHYFGAASIHRNIVVIFVGTGLWRRRTHQRSALSRRVRECRRDWPYDRLHPDGRRCHCGNQGCAETYLSVHAAYEHLGYAKYPGRHMTNSCTASTWGAVCYLGMDEAATVLRLLVINLENLFDPETVIVNGFMPHAILAELERRALPLPSSVSSRRCREVPRPHPRSCRTGSGSARRRRTAAAFYSFGHLTPVSAAMPVKT